MKLTTWCCATLVMTLASGVEAFAQKDDASLPGPAVGAVEKDVATQVDKHLKNQLEQVMRHLAAARRSPAFATRVVWNESLLELDEADLRAWAAVWRTAPSYLCPDSVEYAEEVSYWLGF